METLRAAWDANAAYWIAWARSPECDHAFWRLNLPTLLELVPAPRGTALDLACGEGRVARALRERGHEVVGVDGSPALVQAAREADPGFEAHVADAARLPFPDGHFSLAVASLALMNMDEMEAVVAEVARVLEPGGTLCLSVLHPLGTREKAQAASYFDTVRYREEIEREGRSLTLEDTHRPLGSYFAALSDAGLLIECVLEPTPDADYLAAVPSVAAWRERPAFLHVRALLPA